MLEKILITEANRNYKLYKVEMTDKYGNHSTVYEQNLTSCARYAQNWLNEADSRKESYDSIGNMIEIDRKNGRNFPLD